MITGRTKYNPGIALLLSLIGGGCWALLASADLMVVSSLPSARPLTYTVRLPGISATAGPAAGTVNLELARTLFPRGQTLTDAQLRGVRAFKAYQAPPTAGALAVAGLINALLIFLCFSYLKGGGGDALLLRTHLVLLGVLTALLALAKVVLIFTDWSALWIPLVAAPLLFGLCVGRRAAVGTALLGAAALSSLVQLDLPVMAVALAQGLAASAVVRRRGGHVRLVFGAIAAAAAGAAAHLGVQRLLFERQLDLGALAQAAIGPGGPLRSDLAGALGGALVGALLAWIAVPVARAALGQVSRARLTALADFKHPLLQQLAAEAPGTWAHSTNLANLAETCANRIGVDGLLLRVGAYYHDVGKVPHSDYFVENQRGHNPHDNLEPERSAEVICDHVTDGVQLARRAGLPEAIIEFIYTHHGKERLEFFWHKARSRGRAHLHDEARFCYAGVSAMTREHAILSVCDALEAASHTLKGADKIEQLVRQIVLTKLRVGALDDSGLSVRELRLLIESAVEYLHSSLHTRVEYPWQKAGPDAAPPARQQAEAPSDPSDLSDPEDAPTAPVPLTKRRR